MLGTATDEGSTYGLLASQSCCHSMLAPCCFTLWTSKQISLSLHLFDFVRYLFIFFQQVVLHAGEFGIVYKAHLLRSKQGDDFTFVAVKTLKGNKQKYNSLYFNTYLSCNH